MRRFKHVPGVNGHAHVFTIIEPQIDTDAVLDWCKAEFGLGEELVWWWQTGFNRLKICIVRDDFAAAFKFRWS